MDKKQRRRVIGTWDGLRPQKPGNIPRKMFLVSCFMFQTKVRQCVESLSDSLREICISCMSLQSVNMYVTCWDDCCFVVVISPNREVGHRNRLLTALRIGSSVLVPQQESNRSTSLLLEMLASLRAMKIAGVRHSAFFSYREPVSTNSDMPHQTILITKCCSFYQLICVAMDNVYVLATASFPGPGLTFGHLVRLHVFFFSLSILTSCFLFCCSYCSITKNTEPLV